MSTRIKIRASDDRGNTWERSSDGKVAKLMDDLPWVRLRTGPVGPAAGWDGCFALALRYPPCYSWPI